MSDEIKEILDDLKSKEYDDISLIICEVISRKKIKCILDYITNLQAKYENQIHRYMNLKDYATSLQKENERLSREKIQRELCESLLEECNAHNKHLQEVIDKAIEYIEDNTYKCYETDYMDLAGIKELVNILNGGDE